MTDPVFIYHAVCHLSYGCKRPANWLRIICFYFLTCLAFHSYMIGKQFLYL